MKKTVIKITRHTRKSKTYKSNIKILKFLEIYHMILKSINL